MHASSLQACGAWRPGSNPDHGPTIPFLAKKFSLTLLLMTCGWAGSSAWYECLACIQEDAGSNPARSTTKQTRDVFVRGKVLNTLWKMKTEGYADSTIKATDRRLRMIEYVAPEVLIYLKHFRFPRCLHFAYAEHKCLHCFL